MESFKSDRDHYADMAPLITAQDDRESIDAQAAHRLEVERREAALKHLDELWQDSEMQKMMLQLTEDLGTRVEYPPNFYAYDSHGYPGFGQVIARPIRMGARYREVSHSSDPNLKSPYLAVRGGLVMYRPGKDIGAERGYFALLIESNPADSHPQTTIFSYGDLDAVVWQGEGSKLALEHILTGQPRDIHPDQYIKTEDIQSFMNSLIERRVDKRWIRRDREFFGVLLQNRSFVTSGPDDTLVATREDIEIFFNEVYEPAHDKSVTSTSEKIARMANDIYRLTSGDPSLISEFDVAKAALHRSRKRQRTMAQAEVELLPPGEEFLKTILEDGSVFNDTTRWNNWLPSLDKYPEYQAFEAAYPEQEKTGNTTMDIYNLLGRRDEITEAFVRRWDKLPRGKRLSLGPDLFPFD